MRRRGRPGNPAIEISNEEQASLRQWTRRSTTAQSLVLRAQIILACSEGLSNRAVAKKLGICEDTVGKWRLRFLDQRMAGLFDAPRPGAPRTITDVHVKSVVTKTLESMPKVATHWSTRLMAKATGLNQTAISRIWRAFGLQPHRSETFKLSRDPFFVEKVRDIVGLYVDPPDRAMVLCVDEKTQIQALDRSQPLLPMRPGQVERRTHDYERHGTTSLFAALDVRTGAVVGDIHRRHRSMEFRKFLDRIENQVPRDFDVHLILDNYGTHKTAIIKRWLVKRPRFHLHFTPTGASWLNLVERWFATLTERQIRRGVFRSTRQLETAIRNYIEINNENPKPFIWTKSADDILNSVAKLCQRINDSGH